MPARRRSSAQLQPGRGRVDKQTQIGKLEAEVENVLSAVHAAAGRATR